MSENLNRINRREALTRTAHLLGGALSASTVAGVLAGCSAPESTAAGSEWLPRTLSREQGEIVMLLGEHILPETDTPGARTARVHEFIDVMLSDFYPPEERGRFLAGLERANEHARRAFGQPFPATTIGQQLELVRALNYQAYRELDDGSLPEESGLRDPGPARFGGGEWDPADVGSGSFFRTLKELVLVGYYTSEAGATEELSVNPMGVWRADIPYAEIGKSWA